jgi:hypothetical protein
VLWISSFVCNSLTSVLHTLNYFTEKERSFDIDRSNLTILDSASRRALEFTLNNRTASIAKPVTSFETKPTQTRNAGPLETSNRVVTLNGTKNFVLSLSKSDALLISPTPNESIRGVFREAIEKSWKRGMKRNYLNILFLIFRFNCWRFP